MRTRVSLRLLRPLLLLPLCLAVSVQARAQEQVEYYGTDALGSIRIVFDAAGVVKGRMDFGPFGEALTPVSIGQKVYAQLTFDGETGLDYAQTRMYQSRTGRFNAVDPVYAGLFEPQAWNRYAYALNNPAVLTDAMGLDPAKFTSGTNGCKDYQKTSSPEYVAACVSYGFSRGADWGGMDSFFSLPQPRGNGGRPGRTRPKPPPEDGPVIGQEPPPVIGPVNPTKAAATDGPCASRVEPDFVQLQVSAAIPNPISITLVGVTGSLTTDRYGNIYWGIGPSIGRSLSFLSGSLTQNWLLGAVSQERVTGFLMAHGVSGGGGLWLAGQVSHSPTLDAYAAGIGVSTPQVGGGYSYSWRLAKGNSSCP